MINIQRLVELDTLEIAQQKADDHTSSGKLSASMLGQPLQWQILKYLQVEPVPNDTYTEMVFRRGRDVEDWLIAILKKKHPNLEAQKKCLYRDVIGYLDVKIESDPIEVKSTNSMSFKHILKEGNARKGHRLQGAHYALSYDLPEFNICYVNTDNYQIQNFTYKTKNYKAEIDQIIDDYELCKKKRAIPVFKEIERWNKLKQYCKYPAYLDKTEEELQVLARELYQ